jgi:hypothetical protein
MQGDAEKTIGSADAALTCRELSDLSRMTCLQLKGHAKIIQKKFDEAIEHLLIAVEIAGLFGKASSAFSAKAFLVQAYSELAQFALARKYIGILQSDLAALPQDELWVDRLLTAVRAEVHLHRREGSVSLEKRALDEALELSRWLGDQTTEKKCTDELTALKSAGIADRSVYPYKGWAFLPGRGLLLIYSPKEAIRLEKKSPMARDILGALSERPYLMHELFEKIWRMTYHPLRHETHLRAAISKVRKLLPTGALQVRDGVISLE